MTEPPLTLRLAANASLPGFRAALVAGWSPDNVRVDSGRQMLERLDADPDAFLADLQDQDPKGARIRLPDGSTVPRLPSRRRWIHCDGFAGQISLRWQPGTDALPPTCLGHIGYSVVPSRRGQGVGTRALAAILPQAAEVGLQQVTITCAPDNIPSRRVIERNGGQRIEAFHAPAALGGHELLRFVIDLAPYK